MSVSATLYRSWKRLRTGACAALFIAGSVGYLLNSPDVHSYSNGSMTGRTSTTSAGCDCHTPSSSPSTTLSISGGSLTVDPGSTNSYTLTVANSARAAAGTDIGVKTSSTGNTSAGTLAPAVGSGLQLTGTELTHTSPKTISAGQASFSFTWTAPATPGVYYIQAAANAVNLNGINDGADQWNWLTPVAVTVAGIKVNAPGASATWCAGTTQNITWTAVGVTNVKIELSPDGTTYSTLIASTPASAGSWAWSIPANQAPGTQYRIRISDAANASRSDASPPGLVIQAAPSISTGPAAQTVCAGSPINLSVSATGTSLVYQWRKNGANIGGATGATYSIPSASAGDAGTYDVVVSNACTTATSSTAAIAVNVPPSISLQPQSRIVCAAQPVTFTVGAAGTGLTYQWRKNGAALAGKTDATLSIDAASTGDVGEYDVVVSGACAPAATSTKATLTLGTAPEITVQPAAVTKCQGEAATLSVTATGAELLYQWRKNGNPIAGATEATYNIPALSSGDAGNYSVVVTGLCSSTGVTSNAVALTVNPRPAITTAPASQSVLQGSRVVFRVAATGAASYQWQKNGSAISGATADSLVLAGVQQSDAGEYTVRVTNPCGTEVSAIARLTVNAAGAGALLTFSPSEINFGAVRVGVSKDLVLTNLITNSGDSVLRVTALAIGGANAADFTIIDGGAPFDLAPQASRSITVRFLPTTAAARNATLDVTSNAKNSASATITGQGTQVAISSPTPSVDFGLVVIGSSMDTIVAICNDGDEDVQINNIRAEGDGFRISDGWPNQPVTLPAGECFAFFVAFNPTSAGEKTGVVKIDIAGESEPFTMQLRGTGGPVASVPMASGRVLASLHVAPNPASDHALISIAPARAARVDVQVVDMEGKIVRTLATGESIAGSHAFVWDGRTDGGTKCPAGTYRVVVRGAGEIVTAPVVIVR